MRFKKAEYHPGDVNMSKVITSRRLLPPPDISVQMNDQRKESPPSEQEQASPATTHRKLMRRVALIDGIGVLFVLALAALWYAADVLLLLFACVLCAVLLQELSEIVQRRLGISRKLGLAVVVLLLLLILGLGSWLMAPQISDQSSKLAETVPKSLQRLREVVAQHPLLERIVAELPSPEQVSKQLASLIPNAGLSSAAWSVRSSTW